MYNFPNAISLDLIPTLTSLEPINEKQTDIRFDGFISGWNTALSYFKSHPTEALPNISNLIFNGPATIVQWDDGTKTVVKCQPGDTFNPEVGLMAAMLKRFMGNDNTYNKVMNYWLDVAVSKPELSEPKSYEF